MLRFLKVFFGLLGYGFLAFILCMLPNHPQLILMWVGLLTVFFPLLIVAALIGTPFIIKLTARGVTNKLPYMLVGAGVALPLILACNLQFEMKLMIQVVLMGPCVALAGYLVWRSARKDLAA